MSPIPAASRPAGSGIHAGTNATVTNNAGASIAGGQLGISADAGFANVINSGSITATFAGISAQHQRDGDQQRRRQHHRRWRWVRNFRQHGFCQCHQFRQHHRRERDCRQHNCQCDQFRQHHRHRQLRHCRRHQCDGDQQRRRQHRGRPVRNFRRPAGGSSVFNAGTISGGTAAIQFGGTGNTLTLAQGSVISGNVLGTGSDTFQLGGTGAATFDVSQLGPAAQYRGFGTFNKIGSSVWTLTGTSTYAGPVNVNGGTLAVNGDIIVSEQHHGQCRRHARRQRHRRQHHNQCRRHAGAGQFDRAAHRAGQPRVRSGVELYGRGLARQCRPHQCDGQRRPLAARP